MLLENVGNLLSEKMKDVFDYLVEANRSVLTRRLKNRFCIRCKQGKES